MADLPAALLIAVSVTFLAVEISTGMVIGHTDVQLPKAALYGHADRKVGRWAYLVEVPVVTFFVGGGSLILVLMVVDPDSTVPVRICGGGGGARRLRRVDHVSRLAAISAALS